MGGLAEAFALVAGSGAILTVLGASLRGLTIGVTPGRTAVMGVSLLRPLTIFMDLVRAIAALFAGDIPCGLRIPISPASTANVQDAHARAQEGRPERAHRAEITLRGARGRRSAPACLPRG
ncbi:MAG: tripartite tricarboxylate transporter permease [Pseudomonadota bacterium]